MTETRETMIRNIKITMEKRGIRQKDICDYLGLRKSTVSNWFTGVCTMDVETLVALCRFLGITPNQVYGIDPLDLSHDLTVPEKRLVEIRRNLNEFGQTTLDATAESFASNPAMAADTEKEARAM